ncbi:MAG: DNA primase [Muribaculaceae bacterium]
MIDKNTVEQIIGAADIVEVVSDFVNLRRRGANYVGLCPFHNEKTPSFSVSRAKGICKCFSCGKGGSPVNFIMDHEQLSYYEALKYLAKKYHIEIKERELTNEERETQSERESMLIVNEYASKFFEDNLYNTQDGKEIGLSYFYERGFSDVTIKKFQLGYSLETRNSLFKSATEQGFNSKFLIDTGLCIDDTHGGGYDRFKGRVMFPVLNVAGKVIAFGGRTLKKDLAKYVNSPESIIYKKSNELYGLYQAKQAIVKKEKCFLVEGYTDVISMHQAGIENVVASSGTSLTEGQIRLIHRFSDNVTVLYDGDSAGIKASLRGIDLLLAEGLMIKVLLLPDGDDPDSFARKHNATEFQQYIDENETDFIQFKTKILLEGIKNDPIKRSAVIADIVKSISVIPFHINQSVYARECSRLLDIDEQVLLREVKKNIDKAREKDFEHKQKAKKAEEIESIEDSSPSSIAIVGIADNENDTLLYPYEEAVIKYIVKYGFAELCLSIDDNGIKNSFTTIEYIKSELDADGMSFSNPTLKKIFSIGLSCVADFNRSLISKIEEFKLWRTQQIKIGTEEIRVNLTHENRTDIEHKEKHLNEQLQNQFDNKIEEFRCNYLERYLCSHSDDAIRITALKLVSEKHRLSKIHTKYAEIQTEYNRLIELIPIAINNWKNCIVLCRIKDLQKNISDVQKHNSNANGETLLKELQNLYALRTELATYLGERIVIPKK